MYCIKCGVKLAETEKKCPLCNTVVCHPDFQQIAERPLYPSKKMPDNNVGCKGINGAIIFVFLIPLLVCLFADLLFDGKIEWFGYVAGAVFISYVAFALPLWFKKPNPVIFIPCDFLSVALYLMYINWKTDGTWFLGFALPIVCTIGIIVCTLVTLMYYLHRGKLYIIGGAFIALGVFTALIELLLKTTFAINFIGWSICSLIALFLIGGLLIYLAINSDAREMMERKFFF